MTLYLVPDDDDAFADRDREEPRHAAGYRDTEAPRGRRRPGAPTYFAIVEREGVAPVAALSRQCRRCPEPASVLMHDPSDSDPVRKICPKCAGEIRRRMSY